jgi:hypothetical protein
VGATVVVVVVVVVVVLVEVVLVVVLLVDVVAAVGIVTCVTVVLVVVLEASSTVVGVPLEFLGSLGLLNFPKGSLQDISTSRPPKIINNEMSGATFFKFIQTSASVVIAAHKELATTQETICLK